MYRKINTEKKNKLLELKRPKGLVNRDWDSKASGINNKLKETDRSIANDSSNYKKDTPE